MFGPRRAICRTWVQRWTTLLWLAPLWILTSSCGEAPGSAGPPSVFLISIDTLRADRVGLYGYGRDTTPHLDAFFSAGTVFESATASSPCTVPSVRQFLTGRLERDPSTPTLAERFRDAGYRTAAIVSQQHFAKAGGWHYERGFDHFDVQAADAVDHHGLSARTADEVTDRALAWLGGAAEETPVFLWLHYFDPHDPYEPPAGYRGFDAGNRSPRSGDRRGDLMAERRSPRELWQTAGYVFTPEDVRHLRNLYDGEILFTDAQIGRVLVRLEELGWVESSIVVLLADHGEELGEGGVWDHCLRLSEAELRVPFLWRVRGGTLAGAARRSDPAGTTDLAPTLLAQAGLASAGATFDGRDLSAEAAERVVISQWREHRAVYRGRWKLLTDGRHHRLFDPSRDPGGVRDLARQHPEIVAALLDAGGVGSEEMARVASETALELEQLRSLGYVE